MPRIDSTAVDFHAVKDMLRAGRATDAWLSSWLVATWNDASHFHAALSGSLNRRDQRATLDSGVCLYQECFAAHVGKQRTALVARDGADFVELGFDRLHERVMGLADTWRRSGVEPGHAVAISLSSPSDMALALLAALHVGSSITWIEPLGTSYVATRLGRAGAEWLVADPRLERVLGEDTPKLLSLRVGAMVDTSARPHKYESDDVVLRAFSPFGEAEDPYAIGASALHAAMLRDAHLVFVLDPADRIAAPGFDPVQSRPTMQLAAWTAGAAWVDVEPRDLDREPTLLRRLGVTALGVSRAVRSRILAAGPDSLRGLKLWFRSANDILDYERWTELARMMTSKDVLGFVVLANAASGGAQLFSAPSRDPKPLAVWPVAGCCYQLTQIGTAEMPSLGDSGVFTPLVRGKPDGSLVPIVISRSGDGFSMAGSIMLGPEGRTLPAREIARVAERHPGVRAAGLVVVQGQHMNAARSVLLTFVDPDLVDAERSAIVTEVKASIVREMGAVHAPDGIEAYGLLPRWKDGELDVSWCRSQYLSGLLSARTRFPLFSSLAKLGLIFGPA